MKHTLVLLTLFLAVLALCESLTHHRHHHHHARRTRRRIHHHKHLSGDRRIHESAVPVVLWHGMGDCCCNPMSMGAIKKLIEAYVPGVHVHSLMLGENVASDTERGFLANMNEIVTLACERMKNDTRLKGGYNAVGFSQGGQFVRALAERCPNPPMRNLISVGGQQQGVYGLPYCPGDTRLCNTVRKLLDFGAYVSFVQHSVVQAQYWHDPLNEEEYKEKNIFLADINNAKSLNAEYKKNLLKLKTLVLVRFTKDRMVVPKESSWFGYYKPGDLGTILPMNETELYKEDLIGLQQLDRNGRIHFLEVEGDHLQFPQQEFIDKIIKPYLK